MGSKFATTSSLQDSLPLVHRTEPRIKLSWMLAGYLLLMVSGYMCFRQPGVMIRGNELSRDRAWFIAVNAATLTGFSTTVGVDEYRLPGKLIVFVLMLGGTLFSLIAGGWALARVAHLRYSDRQITITAVMLVSFAGLLGAVGANQTGGMFAGVFQGISAIGNSGLAVGRAGTAQDFWPLGVLLPLSIIGGLGIPVLLEWRDTLFGARRKLSRHSRTVLLMSAGVFIGSILLLLLSRWLTNPEIAWRTFLTDSAVTSLNTRTPGFPLQPLYSFPRINDWLMMLFMMIGAAPGGTGGGLKVTCIAVLFLGCIRALRRESTGRVFGIAAVWAASYALIVFISLLLLLNDQPQMPADRLLFITISAASNVGLSHDPVSITKTGLVVLSGTMLLGRIVPLVILWWMATRLPDEKIGVS